MIILRGQAAVHSQLFDGYDDVDGCPSRLSCEMSDDGGNGDRT